MRVHGYRSSHERIVQPHRRRLLSKSLLGIAAAIGLCPGAAPAQSFPQGGPPVRGIIVEVENQPIFSQPSLLASDTVCAAFPSADQDLAGIADMFVSQVRPLIQRRAGVELVRYTLRASGTCTVTAYLERSDLVVTVRLPANTFETNVTTPDLSLFGADLGLPQGADPRLRVSFDAEAEVRIGLPAGPGGCLQPGAYRYRASNISLPQGVNFTGRIVGALADVASSIYDRLGDGGIGRRLAEGISGDGTLPARLIDAVNQPLCRSGQTFGTLTHRISGDQLVLALGRGDRIADDRCVDGYVWRQLRPDDRVCVTPAVRDQTFADNRLSPARTEPRMAAALCPHARPCTPPTPPTGPAPCRPGFVWRQAVADDFACVTPAARDQAQDDNRQAPRRRRDYRETIG